MSIGNIFTAIITACKFIHREEAFPNKKYKDIRIVEQYQQLASQYRFITEKKAYRKMLEKIKELNNVDWIKNLDSRDILGKKAQIIHEKVNHTKVLKDAFVIRDYNIYYTYTRYPPERGKEFRDLIFLNHRLSHTDENDTNIYIFRNEQKNNRWHLLFNDYKTEKYEGPDELGIEDDDFQYWLSVYADEYRPMIQVEKGFKSDKFFFQS